MAALLRLLVQRRCRGTKADSYTNRPQPNIPFTLLDGKGQALKLARMPDGTYRPADKAPAGDDNTPAKTVDKLTLDPETGKARIEYLSEGKYQLEETVVPANFFPAPPVKLEIILETTSEAPREIVVTNTPQVKLGIDADKFNVVIAIGLTALVGGGLGVAALLRRRKRQGR